MDQCDVIPVGVPYLNTWSPYSDVVWEGCGTFKVLVRISIAVKTHHDHSKPYNGKHFSGASLQVQSMPRCTISSNTKERMVISFYLFTKLGSKK